MSAECLAQSRTHSCGRAPQRIAPHFLLVITCALVALTGAPANAAAPTLSATVIRGSTVYEAPSLFAVYRDHLGKPLTQAAAREIVAALVSKYEADGYSRPQVQVDAALGGAGILRLEVFEARIAEVSINGDPGPHRNRLQSLSAQLREGGPVRQRGMQTALRRMRELPGLSLSATTARDGEQPNVYRLDLDTEFEPISGAVRLSNRGTDEVGPHFLLGQVVANGLLGGQTNLGVLFGAATDYDEYRGLGLLANVGVGGRGTRAAVSGFRSRSDPREPIVDRDDAYLRDRVTLRFTRPLDERSLSLFAGLDLDDLSIARGSVQLRDERLRMLELGATLNRRVGGAAQLAGTFELVKGLNAFGGGLSALDLRDDPRSADFTLARATFTRLARLGERWSLRVDAFAQHTSYVLPYTERFKIGGDRLGRGFEVAEIAGDSGVGAKLEGRRALLAAPALFGRASVYGFYDIGAAWKQDRPGRESAATSGVGVATQGKRVSSVLELAKPLTHADVEGNEDLTLFVELSVAL